MQLVKRATMSFGGFAKPLNAWKFVGRGQLVNVSRTQSFIFSRCYDEIKNIRSVQERAERFDKKLDNTILPIVNKNVSLFATGSSSEKYIKAVREVFAVSGKGNRLSILKELEEYLVKDDDYEVDNGGRVLLCAQEAQVEKALKSYIDNHSQLSTESGVIGVLNSARSAFYHIGRCHAYGDAEDIKDTVGVVIANSGNPITESCRKNVIAYFKKEYKGKRIARLMIALPRRDSDDEDEAEAFQPLKKVGLCVNVAIVYCVIMCLLSETIDTVFRLNDVKRMVNMVNMCLLYMFLLHEGARPGDVLGFQTGGEENKTDKKGDFGTYHKNMYFMFGKQYYMLVLAFVQPRTLAWLMRSGLLKRYVVESYKGKRTDAYRARWKSWFPIEHNSLDLATLYIILMRIWAFAEVESIKPETFKRGLNVNRLKRTKTEKLSIQGLTPYSLRYGAAEEDVAFGIPTSWTRFRMGHTELSTIYRKYAENKLVRATVEGESLVLGSDICEPCEILEDEGLPLFMHPIKKFPSTIEPLPPNVPLWVIEDLEATRKMLIPFFEGSQPLAKCNGIELRIPHDKSQLREELAAIPFGKGFEFRDGLLPEVLDKRLQKQWTFISKHFACAPTSSHKPIIVSAFPQVMFGEWNDTMKQEARMKSVAVFQQVREKEEQFKALAIELGRTSTKPQVLSATAEVALIERNMLKKSHTKPSNGFITNSKPTKRPTAPTVHNASAKRVRYPKGIFRFAKVKVGNVIAKVAMVSDNESRDNLVSIPDCIKPVMVMCITNVNKGKREVTGLIYTGEWNALTYTTKKEIVKITDHLIAHIWTLGKGEKRKEFRIPDLDAVEIAEYVNKVFV